MYSIFDSYYNRAFFEGEAEAQCRLGYCYQYGLYTNINEEQAVYWYRKAAEQGHAEAQSNLGYCYFVSIGVHEDYEQAALLFHKAAEQGHANAQHWLGFFYQSGIGVEKNENMALYWYEKAIKDEDESLEKFLNTSEINKVIDAIVKLNIQGFSSSLVDLSNEREN